MARTAHPSEAFNADIIANAVAWTAFTQANGRMTMHFDTRPKAEEAATIMANGFKQPALIYAINAAGRSALAETINPAKEPTPMIEIAATASAPARKPAKKRPDSTEARRLTKARTSTAETRKAAADKKRAYRAAQKAKAQPATKAALEGALDKVWADRSAEAATIAAPAAAPAKRTRAAKVAPGEMPSVPDFSANTHKPFRKKLAEVVALVEAGDLAGLRAYQIKTVSSSPKAIERFRLGAISALEARA